MYKTLFILTLVLGLVGSSALADLVGYWPLDGDGTEPIGTGMETLG